MHKAPKRQTQEARGRGGEGGEDKTTSKKKTEYGREDNYAESCLTRMVHNSHLNGSLQKQNCKTSIGEDNHRVAKTHRMPYLIDHFPQISH